MVLHINHSYFVQRFSIERCVRLFLVLPSAWTKSVHNFLPIDVSCSIFSQSTSVAQFFLDFVFFSVFFSAQTRFCFFEKNTFFLSHCGHVEGFTAMRGCPTFHTSCIPKFLHIDHHLSIFRFFFRFFLFFVFSFFRFFFERLRCV